MTVSNGKRIINQRAAVTADMQGRFVMIVGGDDETCVIITPEIAQELSEHLKRMGEIALTAKKTREEAALKNDDDTQLPQYPKLGIIGKLERPEYLN